MFRTSLVGILLMSLYTGLGGCGNSTDSESKNQPAQDSKPVIIGGISQDVFQGSISSTVTDWDNDGDPDLLVVDYQTGNVTLYNNKNTHYDKNPVPVANVPLTQFRGSSITVVVGQSGKKEIIAVDASDGIIKSYLVNQQ